MWESHQQGKPWKSMSVVDNCFDVVINVWAEVLASLSVINTSGYHMKEMRNNAARGEPVTDVVEIESPGI